MAGGNRNRPLGQRNDRPEVEVSIAPLGLPGTLVHPAAGQGIVLFAHGSGSSRLSPRNRLVAERLQRSGLGTLLFDLLQPEEADNRRNVFDISLLAERLALATDWVRSGELRDMPVGYFGASTGAGAALVAETLTPAPDRCHRVPRRPTGSGGCRAPAGPGADAPDRRRRRSRGDRAERGGARPSHLREAPGDCARGRAPVRGAGHARPGGEPGP